VKARPSRREVLGGAGVLAVAGAAFAVGGCSSDSSPANTAPSAATVSDVVAFHGAHQSGILTPPQQRLVFASFDLLSEDRAALQTILRRWTTASALLTAGRPIGAVEPADENEAPPDTGEALELGASKLTITVGLGRSVFVDAHGKDRLGLAHQLPAPLVVIPAFGGGENLDPARSGGDVMLQCCADDATVAFHAFHNLTRVVHDLASIRWTQLGFGPAASTGRQMTPRNLQGFKDGTNNLDTADESLMRDHVWVGGSDSPPWMVGGTYAVTRRIRMLLEVWDRSARADQEGTIGRTKLSGAPLGAVHEHDAPSLTAEGADGKPVIASDAHIRLAAPAENGGLRILRRGYSFSDGIDPATGELDAGLFFVAFQRDPRRQFIPLQQKLAVHDALNEYIRHVASAAFAVLPGVTRPDDYLGAPLFA
jgi:deferrochelatase/peroxidase EfeB